MPVGLLDRVRFHELAERGVQVTGGVPLSACPRLAVLATADSGAIDASLVVSRHDSGVPLVRGEVNAALSMPCQRCLDPVDVPVHVTMKLAVVTDETQLIPDGSEPYISADGVGRLADLVEEELLLALPDYPVHESMQACGELVNSVLEHEQTPQARNPFAVLRDLKSDDR
jgi:DUF177 domain-containing protein